MSDNSTIEWTQATWNPVTGCTEVSPGCDHCYARTFAERWRGTPGHPFEQGFDIRLWPERLGVPLRWRKPRLVFVNSMSDLFHEAVPDRFIACVFAVMAATPRHTYQVLTKRHGRMRSLMSSEVFRQHVMGAARDRSPHPLRFPSYLDGGGLQQISWPLPNVWLGVSVENEKWADIRIPVLLETPAAVRWLSCEPLLGPVDLAPDDHRRHEHDWQGTHFTCLDCSTGETEVEWLVQDFPPVDWIVVGGESGSGARPMSLGWVRGMRDRCEVAGVPLFVKQLGQAWARENGFRGKGAGKGQDMSTWPVGLRVRQMPASRPAPAPAEAGP